MVRRLVLVRHGETEHNKEERLQGSKDVPLNKKGRRQAQKLAERLEKEEPHHNKVFSSDLVRASETASIIAEKLGAEVIETRSFRERDFGVLEGESKGVRKDMVGHADELDMLKPEGGEHLQDIRERTLSKVESILEDKEAVIVAHAWVNRAIITGLLESGTGHGHQVLQDNTCVNVLEEDSFRGWQLKKNERHQPPLKQLKDSKMEGNVR